MAEPNEPPNSGETPEAFFLLHLPLIERIVASFARRTRLSVQDTEDLLSWVQLKLIEDDYRRIRSYRGRCAPATFLAATIGNLGKDFLDKLWRRWHPSTEAIRLGPDAVLLERLLHRDGLNFDEACEEMWTKHGVKAPREELERLQRALPRRPPWRREVTDEGLENVHSSRPSPEQAAIAREKRYRRAQVVSFLRQVIADLPAGDRLFLGLNFGRRLSIADISRVLKSEQKELYRRRDKILLYLRRELGKLGVTKEEIDDLFDGGPG